jgi:hypothetical protein
MDKKLPFLHPDSPRLCEVVSLRCHERAQCDTAVLARAFADRPLCEAEDMLCSILESIAEWMDVLQQGQSGDSAKVKAARRISLVAGQIGMTDVALVAGHVLYCVKSGDRTALAATIARLERAFDLAVTEIWNFREI